jgi:hypothetical protein
LEDKSVAELKLYPNPTSGYIVVQLPSDEQILNIRMFDIVGRELEYKSYNSITGPVCFSYGNHTPGRYMLRVSTTGGNTYFANFVQQ